MLLGQPTQGNNLEIIISNPIMRIWKLVKTISSSSIVHCQMVNGLEGACGNNLSERYCASKKYLCPTKD